MPTLRACTARNIGDMKNPYPRMGGFSLLFNNFVVAITTVGPSWPDLWLVEKVVITAVYSQRTQKHRNIAEIVSEKFFLANKFHLKIRNMQIIYIYVR